MSFEEYLIKFNYRETIQDLMLHGYSSEQVSKQLNENYIYYLSNLRDKKIDEILKD